MNIEPANLFLLIGVLACPVAMGLMMWMMNKNMSGHQRHTIPDDSSKADRLQKLREQQRLLEQEIAELEKIAALTTRKESMASAPVELPDGLSRPVEGPHHGD